MGGVAVTLREPTRSDLGVFDRSVLGARFRAGTLANDPQILPGLLVATEQINVSPHGLPNCYGPDPRDPENLNLVIENTAWGYGSAGIILGYDSVNTRWTWADLSVKLGGGAVNVGDQCIAVVNSFHDDSPSVPAGAPQVQLDVGANGSNNYRTIGTAESNDNVGGWITGGLPTIPAVGVDVEVTHSLASWAQGMTILYPQVQTPTQVEWFQINDPSEKYEFAAAKDGLYRPYQILRYAGASAPSAGTEVWTISGRCRAGDTTAQVTITWI